jgi:ABC-type branched-subunit amino acid transport system ATPase component
VSHGLSVHDLHAGYSRRTAIVHGVSLEVQQGETLAQLGPNGSGKSTHQKTVFGLTVVHSGKVTYDGRRITSLAPYRLARLGLGLVPQQEAVFGGLSVRENLAVGATTGSKAGIVRRLAEVLDVLPQLSARLTTTAGALSGGEQRLVAVGRALMGAPRMLLLDEPTAGLAPRTSVEILDTVDTIRRALGLGVLLVEQNARAAMKIADRVLVLGAGEVAFTGSREEALADDELTSLYLGVTR